MVSSSQKQKLCSLPNEPELFMHGVSIKVVKEARFLGITFDSLNSLLFHTLNQCFKGFIQNQMGRTKLCRTLIRSKLDFMEVSAGKLYIWLLDTVHHQGIRLALGAYRTSPVQSLYVEANQLSLKIRQLKLARQSKQIRKIQPIQL